MSDTGFHYVSFDPHDTWMQMMTTYLNAGGDIVYGGDEKEMLLKAVLSIATAILAKVDAALRMDTLTYAVRDYLDLYGEKRNCARIEAEKATATIRITFRATGNSKTYSAYSTNLTADGVVLYHLISNISYSGNAGTVDTTVECDEAGIIGNGLLTGTQLQMIEADDAITSIVVLSDASGGTDRETDESYRERIRTYGLTSTTTGSEQRYESMARAVSGQIVDAKAINDGGGEVGVYLILASGADQNAIFASVAQALSSQDVRPLTDHVLVHAAGVAQYTLNVKVWYSQYAGIGDDVTNAIQEYQSWQDNRIGRAFNPDKLIAMLYQVGCERVQFLEGSGMGTAEAPEYTEIDADAHCVGTITLTVVNT